MSERFESLPSSLRKVSFEQEIAGVPCLLVRPDNEPRPFLFWMHGRTACKELDAGRYLRCVRNGINVCAVDLPGHGQRFEEQLQEASEILEVIKQMTGEIDEVIAGLGSIGGFDIRRAAIGGMSAGGMAAIKRLLSSHPFKAVVLEATTGSWVELRERPMCADLTQQEFQQANPMYHLDDWKDVPVIAFHCKRDEWIPYKSQVEFIDAIRIRSNERENIEFVVFDETGAPYEHVGFGRQSAIVKEKQVEFLVNHLHFDQEAQE